MLNLHGVLRILDHGQKSGVGWSRGIGCDEVDNEFQVYIWI